MFNLKDLLVKFKGIQDPSEKKRVVVDVLNKIIGAEVLKRDEVDIKNHIIFIKSHPALKNKIFTQKKNTIDQVNSILPEEFIVDIR